jgi:hypothetical protein
MKKKFKVLDFEIPLDSIETGKYELCDLSKTWLWQHDPIWFDVLNFENDDIYLEPLLFYYFRKITKQQSPKIKLPQIFWGYIQKDARPSTIISFVDAEGIIYLPNVGNVFTGFKIETETEITFVDDFRSVIVGGKQYPIYPVTRTADSQFSLIVNRSEIYEELNVEFVENISASVNMNQYLLDVSLDLFKNKMPDFFDAIKMTTREYAIFNSINFESFTALHYFGTAFLNLGGEKRNEVFFLDDIAHQSGHIIYYTLTHKFDKFLKPIRYTLLKDFTHISYEQRSVYGAFHGLFTYTTILHCLDLVLQEKFFKDDDNKNEEALARLGFYYKKFAEDLNYLGDNRILTQDGWIYYDMFHSGFNRIKKDYYHIVKYFNYSNQGYNFSFNKFKEANQFQVV